MIQKTLAKIIIVGFALLTGFLIWAYMAFS